MQREKLKNFQTDAEDKEAEEVAEEKHKTSEVMPKDLEIRGEAKTAAN